MSSSQGTPEQLVALMHRVVFDVQEKSDHALLDELFHPDFFNHTSPPGVPPNKANLLTVMKMFQSAFQDVKMEIVHCIAQGNVIATNKILRARQVKDFMGQSASGKMVELPIMDFFIVEDGMLKEHWARMGAITVIGD